MLEKRSRHESHVHFAELDENGTVIKYEGLFDKNILYYNLLNIYPSSALLFLLKTLVSSAFLLLLSIEHYLPSFSSYYDEANHFSVTPYLIPWLNDQQNAHEPFLMLDQILHEES